MKVKELED